MPYTADQRRTGNQLQWGRNLPVAEIRCAETLQVHALYRMASMGPQPSSRGNADLMSATSLSRAAKLWLQWGRNLPVAEIRTFFTIRKPRDAMPCFNGAATFQSRKFCQNLGICSFGGTLSASMGPQPSSRGNQRSRSSANRKARSKLMLQWGRNLPVAEMASGLARNRRRNAVRASMGPQPSSRGNGFRVRSAMASQPHRASMGPQPSSRGNPPPSRPGLEELNRGFNGAATFQSRKSD